MLILIMTLRWDVDDDENVIVYVHGGAVAVLNIPSEGNRVVKEF